MVLKKYYPTVPPGDYTVKLNHIYGAFSKHHKKPITNLIFEVDSGQYKGRIITSTFVSESNESMDVLKTVFSYLSQGEDYKFPTELIGKRIGITVELNRLADGRILNTTKKFFRI